MTGWWLTYPSEKSWSESQLGYDEIPNRWRSKTHVPNHHADKYAYILIVYQSAYPPPVTPWEMDCLDASSE